MSAAYLPITPEVRDRANAYLAGMAARGFVPPPMEEVVRLASIPCDEEQEAAFLREDARRP